MTNAVLAGKYRIEALLGSGGMGSVWRAQHLALRAPVAVKLLDARHFGTNTDGLARFQREAFAAAAIRSAHVVQIFDHGFDETLGLPFIVMELMVGESLAQRLARTGPLAPVEVAQIFTHVARALTRAHDAGIVHRDLKPDNVFLVRNEEEQIAKVLDFGIAKAHGPELEGAVTETGAVIGTAPYMSPEQISGAKNVDYRSDLWSFGVMACECLTGARPFASGSIGGLTLCICVDKVPTPSSLGQVPLGFDAWFLRCVQRDPELRFQSAREAADALRQVCMPIRTQPPSSAGASPLVAQTRYSADARPISTQTGGALSVSSKAPVNKGWTLGWLVAGVCLVCVGDAVGPRALSSRSSSVPLTDDAASSTSRAAAQATAPNAPSASAPSASAPSHAPVTAPKRAAARPNMKSGELAPTPSAATELSNPALAKPVPTRDVIDDRH